MEPNAIFSEIALVLIITAAAGALALLLRQPLIIAFIAVGIIAGPAALGIVTALEALQLLATLGISVLLFVVGLKLDFRLVRRMGSVALATGLGQVVFTSAVGFVIGLLLGFDPVTAGYVAMALTFSSTIIIVKLLSDKKEIDSLHGRISLGLLIVQDVVVIVVLIVLATFGEGGERAAGGEIALIIARGFAFLAVLGILMRYALAPLLRFLSRSTELLVLFAIAWAVSLAALADSIGLSIEVGSFLAGFSLASTEYREVIGARLVGIRDFLLLFFFLRLGATLDLSLLGANLGRALVLSLFVLIGNPLIVMAITGLMGYRKRTGFLTGLTVAQISEFSLILIARGRSAEHVNDETVALVTLVGLITIGLSTYMILYSHPIYRAISPWLSSLERRKPYREEEQQEDRGRQPEVVLFGLGRYGCNIARRLEEQEIAVLGVDFDPEAVEQSRDIGIDVRYGDAEDPEFATALPLSEAKWVVSAAPGGDLNRTLSLALRSEGFRGKIAVRIDAPRDAHALEKAGADLILNPYVDAAAQAADRVVASIARERERAE